jgi:pimeloyl-ACP methyl ester carboxylesterase
MPYYNLHPNQQFNFQFNRILTYGEEAGNIEELRSIAPQIKGFESWYENWLNIAQKAERENRFLHAAYYYRMAEFFLADIQNEKNKCYKAFKENFYRAISENKLEQFKVPYENSYLPVIRFKAENEKVVILVHGGYDSFIEEFYLTVRSLPEKGYTIILFEGPGQGTPLRNGLKFTHEWEKPTRAILDDFQISKTALIGISWGGYLALRAAAFIPKIKQVVAYAVIYNGFDVLTSLMPVHIKQRIQFLVKRQSRNKINSLMSILMKKYLILDWAITHGMYITGTKSPFDFYDAISKHSMKGISDKIVQDVLLLAGEKDHYIPLNQLKKLEKELINVRSMQKRVFTVEEGGEQHCQVGNHQLAIDEIINWLDQFY